MKKYKKNSIALSVLLIWFASVFAIGRTQISGIVSDIQTGEPLANVNVSLEHTTFGSASNIDGEFLIHNIPEGEYHVEATMVGYKPFQDDIIIEMGKDIRLDIKLQRTVLELSTVVVTGTGTRRLYEEMPVKTEVIPRSVIEQKQSVNLADAISMQTGLRVENNCNNCNFTQLRIHGMDGKYSQILIDSDPVVSSLTGVYGLEHFPEEMIEQVEVVKGGGSALYGGGAVAGTVNLITRRPRVQSVRIKYLGHSLDAVGDNNVSAVVQMVNDERDAGAYIFGSVRQRNPYDRNGDGFSELGMLKNTSIGFNYYQNPVENGEINLNFHHIVESRRGGNKFDRPRHEAEISEAVDHDRWGGTLRWEHNLSQVFKYRFFYSFALENRDSYYGGLSGYTANDTLEALTYYGRTENPLHVGGLQVNYKLANHLITSGLEYLNDKIDDRSTADPDYYIDEIYRNFGFYLQDDIRFVTLDQLEFIAGARMDKHSEIDEPVISPRLAGKYNLAKGLTSRLAFSTGFKAPQTFDEDLHLCGLEGDQRAVRNADDLKAEHSYSYSGGLEYQVVCGMMPILTAVSLFHTELRDVFTEEYFGNVNGLEVWQRVNAEGAHVTGVEFDLGIRPVSSLEFRGGFTFKKSEYDEALENFDTKNFLRTPDIYGNLRMSWDITTALNIFASSRYTGQADVPHEIAVEGQEDPVLVLERSKDFSEFDLGISYKIPFESSINNYFKINAGIKNIFDVYQSDLDVGIDRDPAYVYGPSQPRTIYAGLDVSF